MVKLSLNGDDFIKRIDGLNNEVWVDGKRITGKISAHPAFSGVLAMKAKLYDYQVEHCEEFTFFLKERIVE